MAAAVLRVLKGGLAQAGAASPPPVAPLRLPSLGGLDAALVDALRHDSTVAPSVVAAARSARLMRGVPLQDSLCAGAGLDADTWLDTAARVMGFGRVAGPLAADPVLVDLIGAANCLRLSVAPVGQPGPDVVLATSRPAEASLVAQHLSQRLRRPVRCVLAPAEQVEAALLDVRRTLLTDRAEHLVPLAESCRDWSETRLQRAGLVLGGGLVLAVALAPLVMLTLATSIALLALVATTLLKIAALGSILLARRAAGEATARPDSVPTPQPLVSILVPLFREREIASRLVRRMKALSWPPERLEICLVLEEDDDVTREALTRTPLPPWFRLIEVPRGSVKTKPRALNFALPFCRGEIIGVYDAEDAPHPDQIDRAVERFAAAPPDVACLQGVLDFYNAGDNWLTRCFALEYAGWFRVMLPGLARLGLVVPLGGTTLFFRRTALEKLGGWDAHNVTEDADLGLRLARHGFRTELLDSVTLEEANGRAWPWVRQRSRWLKGYAMTWAAHMRDPARLWRDLGPWRFLGVQVLFLGAVIPYAAAPLLWSFWALPLGLGHPLLPVLGSAGMAAAGVLFLACEAVNLTVALVASRMAGRPGLGWWAPTLHAYFPLGTLAAWKGLIEIATRPYYWDKTTHGLSADTEDAPAPTT